MISTKKKPRLDVALSSTTSYTPLLAWLERCGATGLDHLRFEMSPLGSLGCFAGRDFAVGDELFSVPWSCIVTFNDTERSPTVALVKEGVAAAVAASSSLMTAELLLWVFLIEQRATTDESSSSSSSTYGPFLSSLDATSPSPLSWPGDLLKALEATNIGTMAAAKATLEQQLELLTAVRRWGEVQRKDPHALTVLREHVDLAALQWARGHYLARRYPAHFAGDVKGSSSGPPGVAREVGLENLGALVPLLDILNHSDEEDFLAFDVRDGRLHVLCNHARQAGDELLSNYGLLSNERLVFAYGFAVADNPYDTVALKLMCGQGSGGGEVTNVGTYYVGRGGVEGVPPELWRALSALVGEEDEEEKAGEETEGGGAVEVGMEEFQVLRDFVGSKLRTLEASEPAAAAALARVGDADPRCAFVRHYRDGQHQICKDLFEALTGVLAEADDADEVEEADEDGDEH